MAESGIKELSVQGVTKLFGTQRALTNATLKVSAGDVVAIMGPNGAGKSTLLSILSLNMRPTRGKVFANGEEISEHRVSLRSRIGLLSHQPLLYPDLNGIENLRFFGSLHRVKDLDQAVKKVGREMELERFWADRPTRVLSRGQLQRVSLARALIGNPDVLLLDEPAAGLDVAAIERIGAAMNRLLDGGGLAVMVTHEPEVAARVATRAVMIRDGKIVVDEPAPENRDTWRDMYIETVQRGGR